MFGKMCNKGPKKLAFGKMFNKLAFGKDQWAKETGV